VNRKKERLKLKDRIDKRKHPDLAVRGRASYVNLRGLRGGQEFHWFVRLVDL
jgi:hypothetical protein